jgi:hypothetical protein
LQSFNDEIDHPVLYDDYFNDAFASEKFLQSIVIACSMLKVCLCASGGYNDFCTQLAIDL